MSKQKRLSRTFYDLRENQDGTRTTQSSFVRGLVRLEGSTWEELLRSKRIQIVSEAGTGKTYECKTEQEKRWQAGEAAFYVELSQLGNNNQLRDLLSEDELVRYDNWLTSQSDTAILFLDSYDELKLTRGSFEIALKQLGRSLSGQLGRVKIVLTTRPIPFDDKLFKKHLPIPQLGQEFGGKSFADVVMGVQEKEARAQDKKNKVREWRSVELLPLSDTQIETFAENQGVEDTSALLADIHSRNAVDFARRPQDLLELCADWRAHQRIRTHREQVATNIAVKLKAREDRREKASLDSDKARGGASRLALAMLLSRKLNLRYSVDSYIGDTGTALDPSKILSNWSAEERHTLMERALFGFAGYGRVRFHNQSVIEYLAAFQLKSLLDNGMSIKAVKRILFAQTPQGVKIVKPSMRPVAAWLALSHDSVFREVCDREPEVLIAFGDPESLTLPQRTKVLVAYFEDNSDGGWRGRNFERIQLKRFGANDLATEVLRLINLDAENHEARQFLFELASAVPITECANMAFEVAMDLNKNVGERIYAIELLGSLKDCRLQQVVLSMVEAPKNWPERLFTNTLIRLFPALVQLEHLEKLLENRPEKNHDRQAVGDFFTASVENGDSELEAKSLEELQEVFAKLVLQDVKPQKQWPHLLPKREHLLQPLAAICLRLLESGHDSDSVLNTSIATIRLAANSQVREKSISNLRGFISSLPPNQNERAFWAANAFNERFCLEEDRNYRVGEIVHHCELRLSEKDASWVLSELGNLDRTNDQRELLLDAAINWTRDSSQDYQTYLESLKTKVSDCELLVAKIEERLKIPEPNPELEKIKQKNESYRQKQIHEKEEAHASWANFWKEVSTQPEIVFGEEQHEQTVWDLWHAMKQTGEKSRASGWNRRFIEQYFGKETADRLRGLLMKAWRKDKPTFRSERPANEKGNCFSRWELGLAGIAAESENPEWAAQLTREEVELAIRYLLVGYGSLPNWLKDLSRQYPEVVEALIGRECVCELDELADANGHFFLLQKLRSADSGIVKLLVPRLQKWFVQNNDRLLEGEFPHKVVGRLSDISEILLLHGDADIRGDILLIATRRLSEGVDQNYLGFWHSVLLRLAPKEGVAQLENTLKTSSSDLAEEIFAQLFGNHRESSGYHHGMSEFSPCLLLRLLKLAYQKIKPIDDNVHDGPYSPNRRDNAERGRGSILNALLAKEGPDAWSAKIEMANDPLFGHFRDRALTLALEKAAEELDSEKLSEIDVAKFYSRTEAPAKTRDSMFEIMVDRLDDIDDFLEREDSPRETWRTIEEERLMRREIARQLAITANEAYTVDQEAVTANEKETDIRLRSTTSSHQAVIELKLGEKKRSGRELRDTLRDQLVTKYMADANCRSGCLVVTVAKDRKWRHPDTNKSLDPEDLEKMLREAASNIESEMGHSLRLTAKVFDLRSGLQTEM